MNCSFCFANHVAIKGMALLSFLGFTEFGKDSGC